jgi:hypothetical protein
VCTGVVELLERAQSTAAVLGHGRMRPRPVLELASIQCMYMLMHIFHVNFLTVSRPIVAFLSLFFRQFFALVHNCIYT